LQQSQYEVIPALTRVGIDYLKILGIMSRMPVETQKAKFEILVNEKWCKGCEICVAFCPKQVLAMEKDKAKIVKLEACTGCQICEIYCPDFALKVERKEKNS